MPYVNANESNFELIDFPFSEGFTPFWAKGLTFYEEDDAILKAQPGFNSFEIVQARLNVTGGQCILKIGVDIEGVRLFGQGFFAAPTCPPLDEKRGELVPDDKLHEFIPEP